MTYNIVFFNSEEDIVQDLEAELEGLVKKYMTSSMSVEPWMTRPTDTFDRLVYSDVHIAMDPNGNGDPIYDGIWSRSEALKRLDVMIAHVKANASSDTLYIDELGDFLDGLGGHTARSGHELPQNMNDKEAFDLALEFKMRLIDSLVDTYRAIVCHNITEDNHSGAFGYFAASAFKQIAEGKYPDKLSVTNIKRFIGHYNVGKHVFILCHGKDSINMKFGFKPILDPAQIEKIDQYCKEHKLYNGSFIEFSKGDSHQAIFDDTTSNDFSYYSYPAFSPPSNWVKTQYKNSKSGFRFYVIDKESQSKVHYPYYF
jgi:hypothetical protein